MSLMLNASSFNASDFVIPTYTLRMVSQGLSDATQWDADKMQVQMVTTLLSAIFLGIYTFCVAYTAKILIGRGLIGTQRKLFCVTMAMYLATFAYWIALSVSQFQAFYTFRHILSNIYSLIPPADCFTVPSWEYSRSGLPGYCTAIPVPFNPSKGWPSASECVGTVALTFNVTLGDAIVWWRVWVLWNKSRPILVSCCIVLLATLAFGICDSSFSCTTPASPSNLSFGQTNVGDTIANSGAFFANGSFAGTATIALSLFSNAVATSLVGYKTWKHRQNSALVTHLARVPGVVRAQRALLLLVESGIAYCLIWAVVFSSQMVMSNNFSFGIQHFTEGCLLALVGMYPTVIIILVALNKSEIDKQSCAWSLPTIGPVRPSRPRVDAATDVGCVEGASEDRNMRPESVMLIGMPSSRSRLSTQTSEVASTSENATKFMEDGNY